jgi:hypothetical protein
MSVELLLDTIHYKMFENTKPSTGQASEINNYFIYY